MSDIPPCRVPGGYLYTTVEIEPMPLQPHVERGRWWTTSTTRYSSITIDGETELRCETCGGDSYGRYGDGMRCHDCGRLVVSDGEPAGDSDV